MLTKIRYGNTNTTHYHPDHIGLVSELISQGVKLIIMESQTDLVHYSDGIFEKEPHLGYKPIDESQAQVILFEDSRKFLKELGIDGEIILRSVWAALLVL